LYGKLAGDSTLNALLGTPPAGYSKSIYYQLAPQNAPFPYVIFNKQAGTPRYALGDRAYDNDVWLIKGVDRNTSTADPVDNIASRLDALLTDGTISISGRIELYLRRESDVDFTETQDDAAYRHAGALYRLIYA
jgi:hypothetical protein